MVDLALEGSKKIWVFPLRFHIYAFEYLNKMAHTKQQMQPI
jgi:hypothetical protein